MHLSLYLSISIYLTSYLSIYLSICLSICLHLSLAVEDNGVPWGWVRRGLGLTLNPLGLTLTLG